MISAETTVESLRSQTKAESVFCDSLMQTIRKPLLVMQGKNDPRVPASEAEQMLEAIRKNGGLIWFLMATDEGHGFGKKRNADFAFYVTIEFFRTHLLN